MSLWQKGRGISRKIKVMLISIALGLAVAVGGIVTAVSLTGNNKKVDGGNIADSSGISSANGFGRYDNGDKYYYTNYELGVRSGNSMTKHGTVNPGQTVTVVRGTHGTDADPYVIRDVNDWKNFATEINAGRKLTSTFVIDAKGTLDFANATITPVGNLTNAFKGKLYGNSTLFKNAKFGSFVGNNGKGNVPSGANSWMSGLFGNTNGAKLYDITLDSTCSMTTPTAWTTQGYPCVGAFSAMSVNPFFVNCSSKMNISLTNSEATNCHCSVGGFVGWATGNSATLVSCVYTGDITVRGTGANAVTGVATSIVDNVSNLSAVIGHCAMNNNSTFIELACYLKCNIIPTNCGLNCGPITGKMDPTTTLLKVENSVNEVNMDAVNRNNNTPDISVFFGYSGGTNFVAGSYMYNAALLGHCTYIAVCNNHWLSNSNLLKLDSACYYTITNHPNFSPATEQRLDPNATTKITSQAKVRDFIKTNTYIQSALFTDADGNVVGSKTEPGKAYTINYVTGFSTMTSAGNPSGYVPGEKQQINRATGTVPAGLDNRGWRLTSVNNGDEVTNTQQLSGNAVLVTRWEIKQPTSVTKSADITSVYKNKTIDGAYQPEIKVEITQEGFSGSNIAVDAYWVKNGNASSTRLTSTDTVKIQNVAANGTKKTFAIKFENPTVADSGTYTLFYTLKGNNNNLIVPLAQASQSIKLTITKAQVTNPTFTQEFVYDKADHSVIKTAGDSNLYNYTATDATKKAAGDYTTAFTLKDSANYKWKTTTGLPAGVTLPNESGALAVKWAIKKAKLTADKVDLVGGEGGIVGFALNNPNNNGGADGAKGAVSVTGTAKFTYAGESEAEIPGTVVWKTPAEVISYEFFDFTAAESNNDKSIYKAIAVFTPTDTSIEAFEKEVTINVTGSSINLLDVPVNVTTGVDLTPGAPTKLWIDRDAIVKIAPQFGTGKHKITYYWGGVEQTANIDGLAPVGFNAKVYFTNGGATSDIAGLSNVFTLDFSTAAGQEYYGKTFYIGYTPAEVSYSVYYVLENTETENFTANDYVTSDGLHYPFAPTATSGSLDSAVNSSNPVVYKSSDARGTTTTFVQYMEFLNATTKDMTTVLQHYEIDTVNNAYLNDVRIKGDGSTVAVAYLKAKYHTVTLLAIGATEQSMQTQQVKYKAKVDTSKIIEPVKKGAAFNGWYAAASGGTALNFNNVPIVADTTFYAQFISSDYYIVFDMNGYTGNAATAAPNAYAINLSAIPSENSANPTAANRITWNYEALFSAYGEDFEYKAADDPNGKWKAGDYVFHYTVDSLKNNISLTVSTGKPSAISYKFADWYKGDTNTRVPSITAPANYANGTPDEVIRLTAHWTKQTYTLVFDKQDGSRTKTVSGVANLSTWDAIFAKSTASGLKAPTRNGYNFAGWYATTSLGEDGYGEVTTELGIANYFSVADYKNIYKTESGYNFNAIRLYAKWESVEIIPTIEQDLVGGQVLGIEVTQEYSDEHEGSETLVIGAEVEATVEVDAGYQFSYIIVGARKRPIYADAAGKIKFTIANTDVVFVAKDAAGNDYGYAYNRLDISAVFNEITYTISYNTDGGTSSDSIVARTYTITQLVGGSVNLPNKLTKVGYDFGGWVFEKANEANGDAIVDDSNQEINGQYAFVTDGMSDLGEKSLYGETLTLTTCVVDGINWYANFSLKAKWIKQAAELRLYGVNYGSDLTYGTPDATEKCYIVKTLGGQTLRTDETITIKSPVSESFYFIGWATRRGGDVVYAAELLETGKDADKNPIYEAQPVEYKLKASKDLNNADTKANYLYAVWQVKSLSYVNVSATGNNSVYNGTGIKLSAKTAKDYQNDETVGTDLVITYKWYRVKDTDGTDYYKGVFTVTKRIYLDDYGNEIGWITYNADGTESGTSGDVSGDNYIEEKTLNTGMLESNCEMKGSAMTRSGEELAKPVEYTVPSVAEAGRYICVATLSGSESVAFGEITVTMQKATFNGVVFQSAIEAYNGTEKSVSVKLTGNDAGVTIDSAGKVITLPDGTKVTVTYKYKLAGNGLLDFKDDKYYDVNGNLVDENGYLIDGDGNWLQAITNAGKYSVTAVFGKKAEDDKGNYEVIPSLAADFEITQKTLTNITFTVTHEVPEGNDPFVDDGKYSFTYDGNAYVIGAKINDKNLDGSAIADVTNGLVGVNVKIYDTGADGTSKTLLDGDAVNAGNYLAEIDGKLTGENSGNYKIGAITTTQVFEIAKAKRDYGISLAGADVTFNNKPQTLTIAVADNKELPETLTVEYKVEATLDEDALKTYTDSKYMSNSVYQPEDVDGKNVTSEMVGKAITNGGRHAGTYVVTASFKDAESANYEAMDDLTATLTIKKANLFEFYATDDNKTEASGKEELLENHGFVGASNLSFVVGKNRLEDVYINGGLLKEKDSNNADYFTIKYNVYREVNGAYQGMASGTEAELKASKATINAPGKYKVEAEISYASPLYKNDFAEISTAPYIEIEIKEGVIERIEVEYLADRKTVKYIGETFDITVNVSKIKVKYQGDDNPLEITGADLALVKVIYGGDHESFWKVGEAVDLVYEVYGVQTKPGADDKIKVMQKITEGADLRYSTDGTNYNSMPEHGLDLNELKSVNANYTYRLYFDGIDENGEEVEDLYVDVTVDASTLKRGLNVVNVSNLGLYDFSKLEVTLNAYVKREGDIFTWKYSTDLNADRSTWTAIDMETKVLPYIGKDYYIAAFFLGENNNQRLAYAYANGDTIRNAATYTLIADEYTDGELYAEIDKHYYLPDVKLEGLTIEQRKLEFEWEDKQLEYTGEAQKINLVSAGVLEQDINDIDFEYAYYKLSKNADGEVTNTVAITDNVIKNAGDYRVEITGIIVKAGGDESKLNNYVLPEKANCIKDFTIAKANVKFSEVWYEEANYGRNQTYQNNESLRTDKLKYAFGENKEIEGKIYFVKWNDTDETYDILTDKEAAKEYLTAAGNKSVQYMFAPTDFLNYKDYVQTLTINVKSQEKQNTLRVELKEGALPFYIAGGLVKTDRINVYILYKSFYEEDGVEYGKKDPATGYRAMANGQAISETISYTVLDSDTKVTINVTLGSATGSIDFAVYTSAPTSITISEAEKAKIKADWYVGEEFKLPVTGPDAVRFQLNFDGYDPAPLTFDDLTYEVSGVGFNGNTNKFTSAGTATIKFKYGELTLSIELEIKAKENLVISTPNSKTMKYDGTAKAVPVLSYTVDGAETSNVDGVSYTYEIWKGNVKVDSMVEEGRYRVVYTFTVTNPRYNKPEDYPITIDIKSIAYEAVFNELPDSRLTSVYSGSSVTPPVATVSNVKDLINNSDLGNVATVRVTSVNGETDSSKWNICDYGTYTIVTTATYNGEAIGTYTYQYTITRADNSATLTVKNIVVGDEVSYEVTELQFGGPFDESTMITFSKNPESGFTSTVPTTVGTWYIRLEVEGTTNYTRLTIVKEFTISNKNLSSDTDSKGDVMVDVDGGDKGIAPGTVLGVSKVDEETLGGLKIKNQNVHDGYDVTLKDAAGNDAQLDGDLTIKLLLNEDLRVLENKLGVYIVTVDENGKTRTEEIKNVTKSEDGKYLVFSASSVGRFVITEKIPTAPAGLIAGVSVGAVVAAGLIVACVLVFLKKRK